MTTLIKKREGYLTEFNPDKVRMAIRKAFEEHEDMDLDDDPIIGEVVDDIVEVITTQAELYNAHFGSPTVEMIQDWVEEHLILKGFTQVAKSYIKYRQKRTEIREQGWMMDDLQKSIWEKKYTLEGETFGQWIQRVSGGNPDIAKLIRQKKFIFAGRILAHRGLQKQGHKITYSNCYVMPRPEDNIESIFEASKQLARTYSYGGGCGIDISKLRPKGAKVNNSARETSGAVSFMELYDLTTGLIGQNGRRGALMISIADSHPDIEDFIDIKTKSDSITKANISIRVTDDFMDAVIQGYDWKLHWEGEDGTVIEKTVNAQELFRKNAKNNWDWAEAGMLYWDTITQHHMMSEHPEHEFAGVNPCAEEPLMAGGSCLLGSINLSEFVVHPFTDIAYFDLTKFKETVHTAVIGLNEVLDEGIDLHPLEIQRQNAKDWRQIGLGVMGLADMLIKMGLEYGGAGSKLLSRAIADTLLNEAVRQSSLLAKEDGAFPKYNEEALFKSDFFEPILDDDLKSVTKQYVGLIDEDVKDLVKQYGIRNSQMLTIAPTGSISTMWGISGGIEPLFATSYERKTESLHGKDVVYKVYPPIVKQHIEAGGKESDIPTAHTIDWKDRIDMQSVWQGFIDASISSTVNLPNNTTVDDVMHLFTYAWQRGLKGVTIYRDGCRRSGILTTEDTKENSYKEDMKFQKCEECGADIEVVAGACAICMECGHTPC